MFRRCAAERERDFIPARLMSIKARGGRTSARRSAIRALASHQVSPRLSRATLRYGTATWRRHCMFLRMTHFAWRACPMALVLLLVLFAAPAAVAQSEGAREAK